jgi:sugar lactone lactonase YvrE
MMAWLVIINRMMELVSRDAHVPTDDLDRRFAPRKKIMFFPMICRRRTLLCASVLVSLAACGGHDGDSSGYSIGGTVTGLASGASLTLTDNGGDALTVSASGTFSFATSLQRGAAYTVAIKSAPPLQTCTVSAGSGTVATTVTSVEVACVGPFSVGGTVMGLASGASLALTDNGGDLLTISADGPFTFATPLKPGSPYSAAISTLPAGEQCRISASTGTVTTTNATGIKVTCVVPTLQLLAGSLGGAGSIDGTTSTARFYEPEDVAVDASGNLYIADDYNATIRKIDAAGNVTTLAGSARQPGTADGAGPAARFNNPLSITVDASGNVYVVDGGVNTIRQVSPSGVVHTLAGTPLVFGTADGTGPAAQFTNPVAVRWSPNGSLYVTDNNRIRNITTDGVVTTVYSGNTQLLGIDVSDPGFALLTDANSKSVVKLDWTTNTVSTLAGGFQNPVGIAVAPAGSAAAGTVYVADEFAATLSTISPSGVVSPLAGSTGVYGYADGVGASAQFYTPTLMSMSGAGLLWLADSGANTIRTVTATGLVTTVAGRAPQAGRVDGTGLVARFNNPETLISDTTGNLYVGDANAIRMVSTAGQTITVSPQPGASGLALSNAGILYFSEFPQNTIQAIATDGSISVLAGSQFPGYMDGTGTAAIFKGPHGIAADAAGNLFVADTGNAAIRKITPAGAVTTIAGMPGNPAGMDGIGGAAGFTSPFAIAIDGNGTLFVTDGNAIRRITADGTVTTLAGSQTAGSQDGTGSDAQFNGPAGIAIGPEGAVLVSDSGNSTIRKISATGVVTTLIGVAGQAGVKLGPLPTTLNLPVGLAYIDSTLYVVDGAENSVLAITGVF